jgi:trigger factor
MKVAVEEVEGSKRRLAVEAPVEVVDREWERAYGRIQKQARLPGFRKGHVPRSLVKLHFADDVRREVAEHLIPDVYRRAIAEARVQPVGDPDLQNVKLEEGEPLSFVAVVEVKPTITLGEYRGLPIEHASRPVTDEDVERALQHLREQRAEFRPVERPAGDGDLVLVDYTAALDGGAPTSETGHAFVVGDGGVMPEIDAAVRTMSRGEERQIPFRVPDDHRNEALRGKPGTATVKLTEVKEKVLPDLNDEFAKSLGQFETLDAVRAEIRRQLEHGRALEDRQALADKIVDALIARHEFAVPESLVLRQIAHQVEHAREQMRRQGVDPDSVQWNWEKILTDLRPGAERAVRRALLLDAIAEKEGIAPSESDVDAEIGRLAEAAQRPAPAIRRMMEKSGELEALRRRLQERMTLDFLIDHATIRS